MGKLTKIKLIESLGMLLLASMLIYSFVYYVQFYMQLHEIHGTYQSIKSEDSNISTTYEMTITQTGKIKITDVSAGKHVLEGRIKKNIGTPYSYMLSCGYDHEYNGKEFLDMERRTNNIKIYPEKKGQDKKMICVSNKNGTIHFIEKN